MGIERPILADQPTPDLRRVAHILVGWALYDPDCYQLAQFGLYEISCRLRERMPILEDGLFADFQQSSHGILFDYTYGFLDGTEYWIVRRICAGANGSDCDNLRLLGYLAVIPDKCQLIRIPALGDRTINLVEPTRHVDTSSNWHVFAGWFPPSLSTTRSIKPRSVDFVLPWRPASYLPSKIPKASGARETERRHFADSPEEIVMTKIAIISPAAIGLQCKDQVYSTSAATPATAHPFCPTAIAVRHRVHFALAPCSIETGPTDAQDAGLLAFASFVAKAGMHKGAPPARV